MQHMGAIYIRSQDQYFNGCACISRYVCVFGHPIIISSGFINYLDHQRYCDRFSGSERGGVRGDEEIRQRIQPLGPFVDVLTGEAANCMKVIQGLQKHPWSHFACHGILDPVPFPGHSCFKLHEKERLELIELVKARLPGAELGFLSACHAAAAGVTGAPDEVIHLSAAMQFCGFRSVVGTL